jgi:hypothetical protein
MLIDAGLYWYYTVPPMQKDMVRCGTIVKGSGWLEFDAETAQATAEAAQEREAARALDSP